MATKLRTLEALLARPFHVRTGREGEHLVIPTDGGPVRVALHNGGDGQPPIITVQMGRDARFKLDATDVAPATVRRIARAIRAKLEAEPVAARRTGVSEIAAAVGLE